MNFSPGSKRSIGFTLMELLAVIVIIGILAALLFPVLGRMNERAITADVTNRLKQTFAAFQGYAADNNGNIPSAGAQVVDGVEDGIDWVRRLEPYASGKPFSGYETGKLSENFICPVWRKHNPGYKSSPWNTGFGMNYRLGRPQDPLDSRIAEGLKDVNLAHRQVNIASEGANKKILVAPASFWGVEFQRFNTSYMTNAHFRGARRYGNPNPDPAAAQSTQTKGFGIYLFLNGTVRVLEPAELAPYFL